jgi:colicin import membrane protein
MNVFRSPQLSNVPIVALLLAGALAGAPPAQAAAADDAERHRIAEERAAIEARYVARERECRDRFVVTSCVDDAKAERRHALDALRARQLKLDEEQRRARTAERSAELAAKAADDARREQERAGRAASAAAPREPRPLEPRHAPPAGPAASTSAARHDRPVASHAPAKKPGAGETAEQRRENEERHRASFETRQQQANQHRQEVLDKSAQRQKDRPPAAALPVPASVPAR